jgi:L-threonylcarbamoyladenylate synthase
VPILSATEDNIERAAALLRGGELVAFATETVYGLGANALDAQAVQKIFVAKGRPNYNPLIVHVTDSSAARELVTQWPDVAEELSQHFWPGALTLVLPKRNVVPDEVTAGLSSVALRAPSHPVALALLRAAQLPIAAPSANRFTQTSPTQAQHVVNALGENITVLDGRHCEVGIESTVPRSFGSTPVCCAPARFRASKSNL